MFGKPFCRQVDGRDDFISAEVAVDRWSIAGQTMKIGECNGATAIFAGYLNDGFKSSKSDTHIGRMHRNTLIARAENSMYPVEALDRRTACARFTLITRRGDIVEVVATRTLQEVPSIRCHIPELW